MNFLAHVYLSGDDKLIAVGNFIGDFVKGKQYENYPDKIKKGAILHRAIDSYTDSHPLTAEARLRMYPLFAKYAGIYLDVFYDHFLAINWNEYHSVSLRKYTHRFYLWLIQNYWNLPIQVKGFLPNLIACNRLYSYSSVSGIERALSIMSAHTSLPPQSKEAVDFLIANYNYLEQNFKLFFKDLINYTNQKLMDYGIKINY